MDLDAAFEAAAPDPRPRYDPARRVYLWTADELPPDLLALVALVAGPLPFQTEEGAVATLAVARWAVAHGNLPRAKANPLRKPFSPNGSRDG